MARPGKKKPAGKKPAGEKPAGKQPARKKPARKKPARKQPADEKPARKKARASQPTVERSRRAVAAPAPPDDATLITRALGPGDWELITRLFGDHGACGGCWCMWPRVEKGGKTWEAAKGRRNRERFRRLVESGQVRGVLALAGAEPVGWCSFGPREDFPRLDGIRALRGLARPEGTWSVVCFYIPARWRARGVAAMLLAAATRLAVAAGATRVEGYPADPKGKSLPGAFAWTGVPRLFEKTGYRRLPMARGGRPVFVVEPA